MDAALMISPELRDALAKVAVFLLVQGLVYLILTNSSDVFSKDRSLRSLSFQKMRSMSVRRVLAPLSDVPVGTDDLPSPSYFSRSWSSRRWGNREEPRIKEAPGARISSDKIDLRFGNGVYLTF